MHRRLQFGMRENPASDRRHGSHVAIPYITNDTYIPDDSAKSAGPALSEAESSVGAQIDQHASPRAATRGENGGPPTYPPVPALARSHAKAQHEFEPLIGSSAAARLLGNIHVKTLQRYARRGNLPGYQIGGHWYFRESELDSWLHSRLNSNCQPADRVNLAQEENP